MKWVTIGSKNEERWELCEMSPYISHKFFAEMLTE